MEGYYSFANNLVPTKSINKRFFHFYQEMYSNPSKEKVVEVGYLES